MHIKQIRGSRDENHVIDTAKTYVKELLLTQRRMYEITSLPRI